MEGPLGVGLYDKDLKKALEEGEMADEAFAESPVCHHEGGVDQHEEKKEFKERGPAF